jgi:hypothetical protein
VNNLIFIHCCIELQIMKPHLLVIFENIHYICKKKGNENKTTVYWKIFSFNKEWRKRNSSDRVSNLSSMDLQVDALPTELADHRILPVDNRYITKTFTCTHFHNIFRNSGQS